MKYFQRVNGRGEIFYIDERGNAVDEATARTNLVEHVRDARPNLIESSASDTAAAKTVVGHFVQDRNSYGSQGLYKVHSVDEDGSATLHGPVGKGGTKTVSHKDLIDNYADRGAADGLDRVSAVEAMESAFRRFHDGCHARLSGEEIVDEESATVAESAMDKAFRRTLPATH